MVHLLGQHRKNLENPQDASLKDLEKKELNFLGVHVKEITEAFLQEQALSWNTDKTLSRYPKNLEQQTSLALSYVKTGKVFFRVLYTEEKFSQVKNNWEYLSKPSFCLLKFPEVHVEENAVFEPIKFVSTENKENQAKKNTSEEEFVSEEEYFCRKGSIASRSPSSGFDSMKELEAEFERELNDLPPEKKTIVSGLTYTKE